MCVNSIMYFVSQDNDNFYIPTGLTESNKPA